MENYRKMIQQKMASNAVIFCLGIAVFVTGQWGFLSQYKPDGNFGDFISIVTIARKNYFCKTL